MKKYITFCIVALLALFFTPKIAEGQWVQTNGLERSVWCFAVEGMNIYAGTDSGVFHSENNGTSWRALNNGLTNFSVTALAASGTDIFAGLCCGYGIYRSTDNGESWNKIAIGGNNRAITVSGANIFVGMNSDRVSRSIDNGTSWMYTDIVFPRVGIYSFAVKGTSLFAGTGQNDFKHGEGIFRSTDNGTSWGSVNTGLIDSSGMRDLYVNSIVVTGSNIFAGTNNGVFLSTNDGMSWTPVNTGLTDSNITSLVVSGYNLFAGVSSNHVGLHPKVFCSTNNGMSWTEVSTGMGGTVMYTLAAGPTNLFAGIHDSGVWRRPFSEMITSGAVSPSEQPAPFTLDQNHPNPFTTSTTISFTLAERGFVLLDIYDLLGNKVRTLVNGMTDAGSHSVEFDAKNLSAGVYTAKLRVNGVEREMKMIRVGE